MVSRLWIGTCTLPIYFTLLYFTLPYRQRGVLVITVSDHSPDISTSSPSFQPTLSVADRLISRLSMIDSPVVGVVSQSHPGLSALIHRLPAASMRSFRDSPVICSNASSGSHVCRRHTPRRSPRQRIAATKDPVPKNRPG